MDTESAQAAPQEQQAQEGWEGSDSPPEEAATGATAEPTAEAESTDEPTDELSRTRREAADRRVRLREVEAERDRLQGQVAALQRAEVERLAGDRLSDPSDLWLGGVELDALLAEDGTPDRARVTEAVNAVAKAHPSWSKPIPDLGAGARPPAPVGGPSFGDALKGVGR